jgi:hypothetical protein
MEVNPHKKTQDYPCSLCGGVAVVAEKCICGRAALMSQRGYVRLGKYHCGRSECRELILSELEPKSKWAKDYDEDWLYRQPWGLLGGCC